MGFTVIELLISVTLLAILVIKLTLIINEASDTHRRETLAMALEDQAQSVLDKIGFAVIGSDPATLFPDPEAPFWTDNLEYQISLGVEDGAMVWSDPEVIGLAAEPSHLYWGKNEGTPDEQIVIWCRTVADLFSTELDNGADDNLNGLTDESGLSFVLEGNSVRIRLTLERMTKDGRVSYTGETVVTCRN